MKKLLYLSIFVFLFYTPKTVVLGDLSGGGCAQTYQQYNDITPWLDNYEEISYEQGLLRIGLRFLNNENNQGQNNWLPNVTLLNQDCSRSQEYFIEDGSAINFPSGTINFSLRFTTSHSFEVWNDDLNLQVTCPVCSIDFSSADLGASAKATFFASSETFQSFVGSNAFPIVEPNYNQNQNTPVLIVPGLLGTEMSKEGEKLWINSDMISPFNSDDFMDPLKFLNDFTASDIKVYIDNIIKKTLGFDYSESLITVLIDLGYIEEKDLFAFPYDWRYGVTGKNIEGLTVVDLLKQKIQEIKQKTGSEKVNVVAHSTGGLIVKKYVVENLVEHSLDKVVFVGVPNLGAPKALKVLLAGDNFNVFGLSDSEMKKISLNFPVSYELSPSHKYYLTKFPIKIIKHKVFGFSEESSLSFEQAQEYLKEKQLNALGIEKAKSLHALSYENFDMRTAGVNLYNIVGCKTGTMSQLIDFQNQQGEHLKYDLGKPTPGDGTVPLESATNLPVNSENKFYALQADHGKMLSQDGIKEQIASIFSGQDVQIDPKYITQDLSKCNLNGKAISIYSPIDIFVTDESGNSLGLAEDGSLFNNIPNADFSVIDGHKYVYLPEEQGLSYNIKLKGTGQGSFTIKQEQLVGGQIQKTQVFINIPVTEKLSGQMTTNNIGSVILELDKDSNGVADETIQPTAVLNDFESLDLIPPLTTTTISGLKGQGNFYRSDVNLAFEAKDQNDLKETSGVLKTYFSVNANAFREYSGKQENFTEQGEYSISYFSTDRAGNNEEVKNITFIIDKTCPELVVKFNLEKRDLSFEAVDNFSSSSKVSLKDLDDSILAEDEAGNIIKMKFEEKNRKKNFKAEIESLAYNGKAQKISKNNFSFFWHFDKKNNLTSLTQKFQDFKVFGVLASYFKNTTTIMSLTKKGMQIKKLEGLVLLKIITKKGEIIWSY